MIIIMEALEAVHIRISILIRPVYEVFVFVQEVEELAAVRKIFTDILMQMRLLRYLMKIFLTKINKIPREYATSRAFMLVHPTQASIDPLESMTHIVDPSLFPAI